MAVVLKKRAIAELSQTQTIVIEDDSSTPPVPKKLRLWAQTTEPTLSLCDATSSHEVMQRLLRFEEALPVHCSSVEHVVQVLISRFQCEECAAVRAKIINVIGLVMHTPDYNASSLLPDFKTMLNNEQSHKVISQLISCLTIVGQCCSDDRKLHTNLIGLACNNLSSTHHIVRCKCLALLGALGTASTSDTDINVVNIESVMVKHSSDDDARVRSAAFQALIHWHDRGQVLQQAIYSQAVTALIDDYEGVRLSALKLIWVLARLYPEWKVPMSEKVELISCDESGLRLVDSAFAHICHMVNDVAMTVRAEAAGFLGSLQHVSAHFLKQTLDKKLMSDMKRKKSAHEWSREVFETGEWSSGKKFGDDRPQGLLSSDDVSVIDSGACGALVQGLEDEYLEVRNAAIDSLRELATRSESFSNKCQDYLTDMFNDEIESVRLNAIESARKISHHIKLREDQLDQVLFVLKDSNTDIRSSLRALLATTGLSTRTSLRLVVLALLENARRYPADKDDIWQCARTLGLNHAALVLPLVPELLSLHPFFDSPEPDIDDPCYCTVLLLVVNAGSSSPTLPPLLPEHAMRHYAYLRDTMPRLVPQHLGCKVSTPPSPGKPSTTTSTFITSTLARLSDLPCLPRPAQHSLLSLCIRDLRRAGQLAPDCSAAAHCMALYLNCCLRLSELLAPDSAIPLHAAGHVSRAAPDMLARVLQDCHQMRSLFVGLTPEQAGQIDQVRLCAQALRLRTLLRHPGDADTAAECAAFLRSLTSLARRLVPGAAQPAATALCAQAGRLEGGGAAAYLSVLDAALTVFTPDVLRLHSTLVQVKAVINEPSGDTDKELKFTAGLTAGVKLDATLHHATRPRDVHVSVRYPDMRQEYHVMRSDAVRRVSDVINHVRQTVTLSHTAWSEPARVEIGLVLVFDPHEDCDIEQSEGVALKQSRRVDATADNTLALCSPVKVLIQPKPCKR